MSDAKKAGSRDISELKQRLGLKKGGAAQPAAQSPNGGRSGGVVAPPGLAVPQPAQPVIPNAQDDPFGAMNAMAAVAQVNRAPEKEYIVVTHDGKPIENVGQQSHGAMILKIAVPAGIALIVGIAVGKIGTSNSAYNDGLKGVRVLLGDKQQPSSVAMLKRQLSDLDNLLDEAKTKNGFKPNLELDKKLKDMAAKLEVNTDKMFLAKQNTIDAKLSADILSFYAGVIEVKDMIDTHNKAAAYDDIMLKKAKEKADAAALPADSQLAGELKYAVLLSAPTETDKSDFGAKVVEIAGVFCGGNNPVAKCAEGEFPSAYAYRNEPGGAAIKGDLITSGSDNLPPKKIVPLLPNGIRDSLVKGGEPTVSEYYYTRRLRALYDRIRGKIGQDGKPTGGLIEDGNKLETRLQTEAAKGSKFSFFM